MLYFNEEEWVNYKDKQWVKWKNNQCQLTGCGVFHMKERIENLMYDVGSPKQEDREILKWNNDDQSK